jgi:hypothetical protein
MIHSANPTVNRREERLLRERLAAMEAKADVLVMEVARKAQGAPPQPPTFTEEDAWNLSVTLAEDGNRYLPHGSHVETEAVDTTSPLQLPHGRTYTTVCATVTIFPYSR